MAKSNSFTEADLFKLQQKGFVIQDSMMDHKLEKAFKLPTKKKYSGKEKDHIEFVLIGLKLGYIKEHKFLENRKYRIDWAVLPEKIAIEYEGIFSAKSGHTNVMGYSENCNKYNLMALNGWKVLLYTAINYMNFVGDIAKLLSL